MLRFRGISNPHLDFWHSVYYTLNETVKFTGSTGYWMSGGSGKFNGFLLFISKELLQEFFAMTGLSLTAHLCNTEPDLLLFSLNICVICGLSFSWFVVYCIVRRVHYSVYTTDNGRQSVWCGLFVIYSQIRKYNSFYFSPRIQYIIRHIFCQSPCFIVDFSNNYCYIYFRSRSTVIADTCKAV